MRTWYALDIDVEADAIEAVEYGLMEAGALGTENQDQADSLVLAIAYFESLPDRERVRSEIFEALRIYSLPSSSVRDMRLREVDDEDWLHEWKATWQPVLVGARFLIAPPWTEISNSDRIIIRIEPGMAFGTGTHETTRLCLAAIEKHFRGGTFLDVGTGTGILAIAAAKLFPDGVVTAFDTDCEAIAIAQENALLNQVSIEFQCGTIDVNTTASVDCVCANLTAEVIRELLPVLIATTCGKLILSGLLETQVDEVVVSLRELGLTQQFDITTSVEWACVVV